LLSSVESFLDYASCQTTELVGTVRVACAHYLSHVFAPAALARLIEQHPKVQMEIMSLRSFEVLQTVLQGGCDFGICFSPQVHPKLDFHELYSGQLRCVVRKGHPVLGLAKKRQLKSLISLSSILPRAYSGIDICM
jgi:DNA-binding transcriptional LysR family regulator